MKCIGISCEIGAGRGWKGLYAFARAARLLLIWWEEVGMPSSHANIPASLEYIVLPFLTVGFECFNVLL